MLKYMKQRLKECEGVANPIMTKMYQDVRGQIRSTDACGGPVPTEEASGTAPTAKKLISDKFNI